MCTTGSKYGVLLRASPLPHTHHGLSLPYLLCCCGAATVENDGLVGAVGSKSCIASAAATLTQPQKGPSHTHGINAHVHPTSKTTTHGDALSKLKLQPALRAHLRVVAAGAPEGGCCGPVVCTPVVFVSSVCVSSREKPGYPSNPVPPTTTAIRVGPSCAIQRHSTCRAHYLVVL